jgi:multiple sugar transport system ATP-binding protein
MAARPTLLVYIVAGRYFVRGLMAGVRERIKKRPWAFLDIDNVTKAYGAVEVLHRVDISVEEGEFLVLVGPSGCGKSTLLNMIAGLEGITERRDQDQGSRRQRRPPVQAEHRDGVPVLRALPEHDCGSEHHLRARDARRRPKDERDKAMHEVRRASADREPARPQARAAFGRSAPARRDGPGLVRDPDVFLFDEPLSNLDAKLRVDMRTEIKKLHQKLGTTIVYVTHDQIEAMTLSTRIAVMYDGYVQQLGTPKEIYDTPANLFVATFMGSPAMNVLPARLVDRNGALHAVLTSATGQDLALRIENAPEAYMAYADKPVILGIRPEAITDPEGADRNARNIQPLSNTVGVTEPAGSDTFVTMTLSGKDCIARMRADADVHVGQDFDFAVNMDKAVLFDPETEKRIA